MKLLLQHKIFIGYFLLMAIIGSMVAIVLHERNRVRKIEDDSIAIFQTQHHINTAHRYVTTLATYGESVIVWNKEDSLSYRERRMRTDSLLQILSLRCRNFIQPAQIDSLRTLLVTKEEHLFQLMEAFQQQKKADSLLFYQQPIVTAQVNSPRTVTRKKKGIVGFFGGKETVQLPPVTTRQNALNKELIFLKNERQRAIEIYMDSLRLHNRKLNRKLRMLITSLDEQTSIAFQNKEEHLKASYEHSSFVITGLIAFSIILLFVLYFVIQRDIKVKARNRKRLEETIEQNNALLEMRKNIILTISHDIRAPLNIINGNAELAADTRDRKRRNRHLANIGTVSRHILHLLNNLLDMYRLNDSKETCNNVPFSLNDLLERIATGVSLVVINKGILFLCDFKDTDVVLQGDVDRIEQIIDNLLANAVKFTETGTIHFNVAYKDGNLSLEIRDTGIGMDENTLSRIFRPFERLASEMNADGFGLGLPITKGLVNLMGGTIDVESETGCGSTFRVSLPLPLSGERIEHETSALPATLSLPQSVLVIDNDRLQLEIVKEMMERNGVSCTACSNARELVKEMRKRDYDLLLSDIQMPGTNGFEILNLLRNSNIGNSRTIPVIAMTARGDREKEAFAGSGFADCIYKPFSMNELLDTISATAPHKDLEEPCVPDFDTFTADVRDKRKLIQTFIIQSRQDMADLQSAINANDIAELRDIAHRIQPSLELLQAEEPVSGFRTALKNEPIDPDTIEEYTKRIIKHISMLVTAAENTINRMTHETENTDS